MRGENTAGLLFRKKKCIKAGFQRVQRGLLLGKVIPCSAREETWWVYCFEKRNVSSLDFTASREGFCWRGWGRSLHVVQERKCDGSTVLEKEMY